MSEIITILLIIILNPVILFAIVGLLSLIVLPIIALINWIIDIF